VERQRAQVYTIEPEQIESDIGGCSRTSEEVVKLRSASVVSCDNLTVDNRVLDLNLGSELVGELVEAAEPIPVPGNQTAAAWLDVAQGAKIIVLHVEHPFGVIKRIFAPSWPNWLNARECHSQEYGWRLSTITPSFADNALLPPATGYRLLPRHPFLRPQSVGSLGNRGGSAGVMRNPDPDGSGAAGAAANAKKRPGKPGPRGET
jgi:hypothetical protein